MIISGDTSRVSEMIDSMAKDVRNLLRAAVEIAYFSRASLSYETVLHMSALERDIAVEFINKRLEIAGKSPFPVY
jgi:hypothetical protein